MDIELVSEFYGDNRNRRVKTDFKKRDNQKEKQ